MGLQNLGLNNNDDEEDDDEDEEEQRSNTRRRKRRKRRKKDTTNEEYNRKATMKNMTGTIRNSTSLLNVPKEKEPE